MTESERLARQFHDAYVRLVPQFGWAPQSGTTNGFDELPEAKRNLMLAVAEEILCSDTCPMCRLLRAKIAKLGLVVDATRKYQCAELAYLHGPSSAGYAAACAAAGKVLDAALVALEALLREGQNGSTA